METQKHIWNYKIPESAKYGSQEDWNQTLMAMMNQTAAQYYKTKTTRESLLVKVPEKFRTIIESLMYYRDGVLSQRYDIVFTDTDSNIIDVSGFELEILGFDEQNLENKLKIIDEICKFHPSYGTKKGWSEYVGGMADRGDWFFRKMLDVLEQELQEFLDELKHPDSCKQKEQRELEDWLTELKLDEMRETSSGALRKNWI